jgi:biotin carboxyl carrier protein
MSAESPRHRQELFRAEFVARMYSSSTRMLGTPHRGAWISLATTGLAIVSLLASTMFVEIDSQGERTVQLHRSNAGIDVVASNSGYVREITVHDAERVSGGQTLGTVVAASQSDDAVRDRAGQRRLQAQIAAYAETRRIASRDWSVQDQLMNSQIVQVESELRQSELQRQSRGWQEGVSGEARAEALEHALLRMQALELARLRNTLRSEHDARMDQLEARRQAAESALEAFEHGGVSKLTASVSGQVRLLDLQVGQYVHSGQALAHIDRPGNTFCGQVPKLLAQALKLRDGDELALLAEESAGRSVALPVRVMKWAQQIPGQSTGGNAGHPRDSLVVCTGASAGDPGKNASAQPDSIIAKAPAVKQTIASLLFERFK